ncbi:MAG: DUF167 domain-containing protein [Candidatus Marsarchaeota archaeon]|nr:DUF167 domain-containing protein [Candidatus Marsarchaeota archaeon]MCL5106302.1 DUF167 domain-containing protein [Candidatus Marsarchaeota archaeon]
MRISVKVIPNAKSASVNIKGEAEYAVRVDAPAHEGKANKRLIEILSGYFRVSKSCVRIIKGASARSKAVEVDMPD